MDIKNICHTRLDAITEDEQFGAVRMTRQSMSPRSGCQCKVGGDDLRDLLDGALASIAPSTRAINPMEQPEDCAVITLSQETLLATTDLGPLVGVDLAQAGRIAARHALSDVYAMGGQPLWALATLIVNPEQPLDYARIVLAGVLSACSEDGVQIVGGQTIYGPEAMAGLTVFGVSVQGRIIRKTGARPGDKLLISKPLGVGLIVRAFKLGILGEEELGSAVAVMAQSNGPASRSALNAGVRAGTDVTGFGFLGHLAEMLDGDLGAMLDVNEVPVLGAAMSLPQAVSQTTWIRNNFDYALSKREINCDAGSQDLAVLLDPQTNGGLLVAAEEQAAASLAMQGFVCVGQVTESGKIEVR